MRRTMSTAMCFGVCSSILFWTGCEDPKKKIAQLEEEKKALGDQLLEASQERDAAQSQVSELQQQTADLQSALAQAKQAPPPPPAPMLKFVGAISAVDLGRANHPSLSAKAKKQLDDMVPTLKGANQHVYVVGHTDNDPIKRTKWKDNLELSSQRAMAVVRYLMSKGVSNTRLLAAGAGEFSPIVPNSTPANKAKNRRVEIYVGPAPSR